MYTTVVRRSGEARRAEVCNNTFTGKKTVELSLLPLPPGDPLVSGVS